MKHVIGRILIVFSLLLGCFTLTGCDEWNLKQSEIELYVFSCDAINAYTDEAGNKLSASIGNNKPLRCSAQTASQYATKIVFSDIKAVDPNGPLYYSVVLVAPLKQQSKRVYTIAATIAFEVKETAINSALSEFIYCTEHNDRRDSGGKCVPYNYSNKAAYTPTDVKEIVTTAGYEKNKNAGGSRSATVSPADFSFDTAHIELAKNINVSGLKTGSSGVAKAAVRSTFDDSYTPITDKAVELCTDGLAQLFDAQSLGGYSYTYNNTASKLLVYYDMIDEKDGLDGFGDYELTHELDSEWVSSNIGNNIYQESSATNNRSTAVATCRFTVTRAVGTMSYSARKQIKLARVYDSSTNEYTWYVVGKFQTKDSNYRLDESGEYWNKDSGFIEQSGVLIDNEDTNARCPYTNTQTGTCSIAEWFPASSSGGGSGGE